MDEEELREGDLTASDVVKKISMTGEQEEEARKEVAKLIEEVKQTPKERPREELLFEYIFDIEEVDYRFNVHSDTWHTPMGSTPSVSGVSPKMLLKVSCVDDETIPVKSLEFLGYLPLEKGDRIKAQIPQYYVKEIPTGRIFPRRVYFERDLKEKEISIRLEKLAEDGTVLARARGRERL